MSIQVRPNADGSYTVSCEGVDVVVGGASGARSGGGSAPDSGPGIGPIVWPDDPDENGGGAFAYLHVDQRRVGRSRVIATYRPEVIRRRLLSHYIPIGTATDLTGILTEAVHLAVRRGVDSEALRGRRMVVNLLLAPGEHVDPEHWLGQARPVAEDQGLRIELHFYVGTAAMLGAGV